MTLPPREHRYAETWASRGVPLDQLPGLIERARAAGAPAHARLHLEDAKANILAGMPAGGTRAYISWSHQEPDDKPRESPEPDPEETTA